MIAIGLSQVAPQLVRCLGGVGIVKAFAELATFCRPSQTWSCPLSQYRQGAICNKMNNDDSEVLSFPLELDPEEQDGRDAIAENVYQHESSDFTIVLRQLHTVHGKWANDDSINELQASLLVYRLELHSRSPKQDRRFKHVSVNMRFQRDPPLKPSDDPTVKSFEPAQGIVITQLPTDASHTAEKSIEGQIGTTTGVIPANFNSAVHYRNSRSTAWTRSVRVRISGVATKTSAASSNRNEARDDPDAERLGDDCITWSMRENPLEKEIPDSYGLAVLLQRPNSAKFRVLFRVKATIDFRYKISNIFDTFYGYQQQSRLYDPSVQKGQCPERVNANDLSMLTSGTTLSQLSFSHLPEEFKPVCVCKPAESY